MIKKLAHYLIRPQRAKYTEADLGDIEFEVEGKKYKRYDHQVKTHIKKDDKGGEQDIPNQEGISMACSIFEPSMRENDKKYNTVIFCHGNSGNRCAVLECRDLILRHGFLAVCFDFSGCGNSNGKYVRLGKLEKFDIQAIVQFIRGLSYVQQIGLWGRSMGAASALMYGAIDPSISVLCLDSPFRSLQSLIQDFMNKFRIISALFGGILYSRVSKYLLSEANLSITDVQPIEAANKCRIDAIFVHAIADKIIKKAHSDDLVSEYKGRKKYYNVSGGHNDIRNEQLYTEILNFFDDSFNKHKIQPSQTNYEEGRAGADNRHSEQKSDPLKESEPILFGIEQPRNFIQRSRKRRQLFFKASERKAEQSQQLEESGNLSYSEAERSITKEGHANYPTGNTKRIEFVDLNPVVSENEVDDFEEDEELSNAFQQRCDYIRSKKKPSKKNTITFHNFVEISSPSSSSSGSKHSLASSFSSSGSLQDSIDEEQGIEEYYHAHQILSHLDHTHDLSENKNSAKNTKTGGQFSIPYSTNSIQVEVDGGQSRQMVERKKIRSEQLILRTDVERSEEKLSKYWQGNTKNCAENQRRTTKYDQKEQNEDSSEENKEQEVKQLKLKKNGSSTSKENNSEDSSPSNISERVYRESSPSNVRDFVFRMQPKVMIPSHSTDRQIQMIPQSPSSPPLQSSTNKTKIFQRIL